MESTSTSQPDDEVVCYVSSIIMRLFQDVLLYDSKSDCYFVKLGRKLMAVRIKTNWKSWNWTLVCGECPYTSSSKVARVGRLFTRYAKIGLGKAVLRTIWLIVSITQRRCYEKAPYTPTSLPHLNDLKVVACQIIIVQLSRSGISSSNVKWPTLLRF